MHSASTVLVVILALIHHGCGGNATSNLTTQTILQQGHTELKPGTALLIQATQEYSAAATNSYRVEQEASCPPWFISTSGNASATSTVRGF